MCKYAHDPRCCHFAEKETEGVKLRKDAMEQDRASRQQLAEKRDMEEELGTLRMKISSATDGAKKATAQAESAMQVAREEVQTALSQACSPCLCTFAHFSTPGVRCMKIILISSFTHAWHRCRRAAVLDIR